MTKTELAALAFIVAVCLLSAVALLGGFEEQGDINRAAVARHWGAR